MWAWGNLVDHRPGEGHLRLILQVVEEGSGHQSVLHPALSVGEDASLHLVAIVRAVIHRLHSEWQLSGVETLQQQGTHLTHSEEGLQSTSEVGLVEGIALLGDGERDHLQAGVTEDFHQSVPVLELRIGLQGLGDAGDDLLLDRTVRAEVHAEREVVVGCISLVDDLKVEGLGHNHTTVVLAGVQCVVEDGSREGAKNVSTTEVYPCGLLGGLLAQGLDVELGELIAFLLPLCGVVITAKYVVQFHNLIKESGLFVFYSKFTVNGGEDTLYLSECEHAAQQGVAGIVAVARLVEDAARLVGKRHTVVNAHGQLWVLLLEDTAEFDKVGTSAQVTGLGEVAVGEDVARTQVNEVCARSKLLGQLNDVVVSACTQATGAERQAVVFVGYGVEEPLDILLGTDDTWQAENLDGGIVGVNAHIHVALLANGHDSLEEVLHVGTELGFVYTFI